METKIGKEIELRNSSATNCKVIFFHDLIRIFFFVFGWSNFQRSFETKVFCFAHIHLMCPVKSLKLIKNSLWPNLAIIGKQQGNKKQQVCFCCERLSFSSKKTNFPFSFFNSLCCHLFATCSVFDFLLLMYYLKW